MRRGLRIFFLFVLLWKGGGGEGEGMEVTASVGDALGITSCRPGALAEGVAHVSLRVGREIGTFQHEWAFLLQGIRGLQVSGCLRLALARLLDDCCVGKGILGLVLGRQWWFQRLQVGPFAFVAWPPGAGVVCPGELAADGGHGDGEIVLGLQEVLDILELQVGVLVEEGDDSLKRTGSG